MVLVTSSGMTILLSSALISTFTFLLFLSGYILQQQTVRALQEALRVPPPPKPTLPTYFSDLRNAEIAGVVVGDVLPAEGIDGKHEEHDLLDKVIGGSSNQEVLQTMQDERIPWQVIERLSVQTSEPRPVGKNSITQALEPLKRAKGETVKERQDILSDDEELAVYETRPSSSTQTPIAETEAYTGTNSREETVAASPDNPSVDNNEGTRSDQQEPAEEPKNEDQDRSPFAYVLLTPTPSLVCSAIMFYSHLSYMDSTIPNRIILYPAYWEDSHFSESHTTALGLLKQAVKDHRVTIQPLRMARLSTPDVSSNDIELAMLATMSSTAWTPPISDLRTLLYLRSPGLLMSASALDRTLTTFDLSLSTPAGTSDSHRGWNPLQRPIFTTPNNPPQSPSHHHHSGPAPPTHMMLQIGPENSQFFTPASLSTSSLVIRGLSSHSNHHVSEIEIEAKVAPGTGTAYVLFSEAELRHRRGESQWYGGVYERFERGRREVCPASVGEVLELAHGGDAGGRRRIKGHGREPENGETRGRGW